MSQEATATKLDLIAYVGEVERELTTIIGRQREVLTRFLEEQKAQGASLEHCGLVDCAPLERYRAAIRETIRVLGETKRSFKSRQLEELRRHLEALLAEESRNL